MAVPLSISSNPLTSRHCHRLYFPSTSFKGNVSVLGANPSQILALKLHQRLNKTGKQQQFARPLVVMNQTAATSEEVVAAPARFRLDNLGPQPGSRKRQKRKGRGISAGQGASCGFGMRGQKSRSGPGIMRGFEGGQTALYRRLPKLRGIAGGMRSGLPKYIPVNLKDVETAGFEEGDEVSLETLKQKGLINPSGRERKLPLKVGVVEDPMEVEVAQGYTMAQFCDKIIDLFLNEKPKVKEWKKYLVLRDEWNKYSVHFYKRCRIRADTETDPMLKQKLISLETKVKKIDEEMEKHNDLLKEIQENPTDINAIAAKRRRDFTGEFFRYVTLLSETLDGLEDRDAVARLATRCLSAVSAYDNTLESVETLDAAQAKFDDILNSPSVDAACEKIRSLAKSKELDSSLILLINSAYAAAKESQTVTNEAKDIMYHLYKATKSSLRSITPKEIKLLKYLLNITDPEERFSALATAFSPGDDHEAKDPKALYTTPKELHKWIKIMLDAYHLNKEETDIREAKQMSQPIVIQRLFILKDTIEEEYLDKKTMVADENPKKEDDTTSVEEFLN